MKSILLLEDDSSLGATLSERLQKSYQVKWCKDIASAHQALAGGSFDLAVLDVGLPDGSGFDLAKEIREKSLMPFIFVTALGEAENRLKGYEIGAEEYIPKPFHLKELMLRVEHVLDNHSHEDIYEFGSVKVHFDHLEIRHPGHKESLNFREAALLRLLIKASPRPVSRDQILNSLWGEEEFPSNRTVDNIVLRLRQALGSELGTYLQSVRGVGYKWEKESS